VRKPVWRAPESGSGSMSASGNGEREWPSPQQRWRDIVAEDWWVPVSSPWARVICPLENVRPLQDGWLGAGAATILGGLLVLFSRDAGSGNKVAFGVTPVGVFARGRF